MVDHLQAAIGRNDIDVIGLEMLMPADFNDAHLRTGGNDIDQLAAVLGIEMHDHHEGGAGVVWQHRKQVLQGVDTARRGADGDDHREIAAAFLRIGFLIVIVSHVTTLPSPAPPAYRDTAKLHDRFCLRCEGAHPHGS